MVEFIFRLALEYVYENILDVGSVYFGDDFLHERCLSPSARRNKNGVYAMREIGMKTFGILCPISKICSFSSLAKDKWIFYSHIFNNAFYVQRYETKTLLTSLLLTKLLLQRLMYLL